MHTIDFNQRVDGKNQAAFVIFYALDGQPWQNYQESDYRKSGRKDLIIPTCLMINRCDGQLGFIGGRVEEGESTEQAAVREVREEIGHTVSVSLEPIAAHDIGPITTHAFAAKLTYLELRTIQQEATAAEHFGSEVTGLFLPHLIDYDAVLGKGQGISSLLQNSMAPSVREELVHFLLKKNVFNEEHLSDIVSRAGFELNKLLD